MIHNNEVATECKEKMISHKASLEKIKNRGACPAGKYSKVHFGRRKIGLRTCREIGNIFDMSDVLWKGCEMPLCTFTFTAYNYKLETKPVPYAE